MWKQNPTSNKIIFSIKYKLCSVRFIHNSSGDTFCHCFPREDSWIKGHPNDPGWREFPVIWPAIRPLPVVKYSVSVYTGDKDDASLRDANTYITLHGNQGSSSKHILYGRSNHHFQQGQADIFEIEAVSLDQLSKIVIGHDNEDANWFLNKIIVRETLANDDIMEYIFLCDQWFSKSKADGLIERELLLTDTAERRASTDVATYAASTQMFSEADSEAEWEVMVTTSVEEEHKISKANVTLTVYGDRGNSGPVCLGTVGENLAQPGDSEKFNVNISDVGKVYKIRIEHDNNEPGDGWYIEKIIVQNRTGDTQWEFEINRWLDAGRDDGAICREIPIERADTLKYIVQIYTGSQSNSALESTFFLMLSGTKGDTGRRFLNKSLEDNSKFEPGNCDTFVFEAVDLGELESITVGHDGKGPGSGWFVDKVVVKVADRPSEDYVYKIGQWFDATRDDGLSVRTITS